jgi:hypothetical protein
MALVRLASRDPQWSGPGFIPCASCGCLVLVGRAASGLEVALTPCLGEEHRCGANCACGQAQED